MGAAVPVSKTTTNYAPDSFRGFFIEGSGMGLLSSGIDTSSPSAQWAFAQNNIADMYKNILGRDADAEGLKYWTDKAVNGGLKLSDVENYILGSDENLARHNGDKSSVIKQAYQVKLGRDADTDGLNYWNNAGDASTAIWNIDASEERRRRNQSQDVSDLYKNLLNREADQSGADYWRRQNLTNADRGMNFLRDTEYQQGLNTEWTKDKQAASSNKWGTGYDAVLNPATGKVSVNGKNFDANDYAGIYAEQHRDELNGLSASEHWQKVGQFKGYDWGVNAKSPPTIYQPYSGTAYQPDMISKVVAGNETIEGRLERLLSKDNPVMQQAANQARMSFASRGLLNSSMGEQAALEALISKAIEIAGPDAQRYFQNRLNNVEWTNRFAQDYQQQQYTLQNMAVQHQYNMELTSLNSSLGQAQTNDSQGFALRQNYLQSISQANNVYQTMVAQINGASMTQDAKTEAINSAKTLRDSNISLVNSAFNAQPGWQASWLVEAS